MPESNEKCIECNHTLTDAQLEKYADLAVQKLTQKFYMEIGKTVFDKFLVIVGLISVGIYFYLQTKGIIK
ncbi:MAG: hypothetical protein NTY39_03430 [Campylobacterales bacterium]|nr:hypothetical protein [Campylobacterales bacterium]